MASYTSILRNGFWDNNPGFVQLLGLCPLLAVSTSFINGLGMGLATTVVLAGSNLIISMIRRFVRQEVRIAIFVVVIAGLVTTIQMIMNAYFHELYNELGIFIPLIVTNCIIIGRAEAFASHNHVGHALADGISMGLGFTLVLVLLGSGRELVGFGTLFAHADMLFGPSAAQFKITVAPGFHGLLLAALPPGAFMGLGLLIAIKNWIDAKMRERQAAGVPVPQPAESAA